jgi:hypothetical protein
VLGADHSLGGLVWLATDYDVREAGALGGYVAEHRLTVVVPNP